MVRLIVYSTRTGSMSASRTLQFEHLAASAALTSSSTRLGRREGASRHANLHRRGPFSPTEKVEFTEKLEEYTAIETLQTYLICSQDEPRAWAWARQGDGSWLSQPTVIVGREGAIAPAGLGIELTMAAIFRGIPDASSAE